MYKSFLAFALFLLLPVTAYTASQHQHGGTFTQHYSDTFFQVTEKGLFSVELLASQGKLVTGENNFQVVVHDRNDKDVSGANVTATAEKAMGAERAMQTIKGMDRDGGLYTFSGLELDSPGHWKLTITIRTSEQKDAATFDFPNVEPSMQHRMEDQDNAMQEPAKGHMESQMHHHDQTMERPEHIDTSTQVMSEKGLFKVGYDTAVKPIPVGRIHKWRVQVLDKSGNPVNAARILISGSMPEHGHGLPTEPEVTSNLGDGVYEIHGMRFSMPGWWVLKFQVLTMDKRDTATFNLLLE